ncbi:hypothetical protein D2E26_1349 [Bifidobacterium dolichotidis]|uniref:DUF5067 domain-containing protein n=1 Tax=Bifidobacterium dolichotidis TaxID=2306976 RepID=A0A430FNZ8_9BIFI|nr:DUF5067 domain-containing protein [Bifidobacterium dolichotidis]RSX54549.1 hypothetical protein D2E26_1349 [Bifidobacterium dolichotidis]
MTSENNGMPPVNEPDTPTGVPPAGTPPVETPPMGDAPTEKVPTGPAPTGPMPTGPTSSGPASNGPAPMGSYPGGTSGPGAAPMGPPPTVYGGPGAVPPNTPNPAPPQQKSALALAGLIIGAVALALCWIPVVNVFAIILALVGLALAIVGIVVTVKGKRAGKVLAIVGASLSAAALIASIVVDVLVVSTASKVVTDLESADTSDVIDGLKQLDDEVKGDDKSSGHKFNGEGQLAKAYVNITKAETGYKDYDDKPVIIVTYEWKNTSDDDMVFSTAVTAKAFQNGTELSTAVLGDKKPEGYDAMASLKELKPGATSTVMEAYELDDTTSDVVVECESWLSWNNHDTVEQVFSIK